MAYLKIRYKQEHYCFGTDIVILCMDMKKLITVAAFTICLLTQAGKALAQDVLDTVYTAHLEEVVINEKWGNDTARYRYNQLKYYVKSILPYVNASSKLFNEINAKANEPGITKSEKKKFIATREEALRAQFEDKVKGLNKTQGALLMKLIARQTGANIYKILDEFKNPLTAMKWQTWARVNGFNLNRKYHPEEEQMLEQVMESLGYPLPELYNTSAAKL